MRGTARYIFPNSYAPSLSEIVRAVEQTGFYITDVEVLRTHYAKTISEWSRRFDSVRDQIIAEYDESFFRMFEYYLKISEFAFRNIGHVTLQIQLAKKQDTVPVTRGYLADKLPSNAVDECEPMGCSSPTLPTRQALPSLRSTLTAGSRQRASSVLRSSRPSSCSPCSS